ncbi:hypothetical protein BOTCAL_0251g00100 [Botryotinia calthae]|uniref:Uncharacterized protein n=1 Tax=Botryotinia calthae TaxID=38488 RepID=A0A4Y8CX69_9HELO|nr:hypothetical protein BOTCAL_0251g00100 [Botryotinia calthae]
MFGLWDKEHLSSNRAPRLLPVILVILMRETRAREDELFLFYRVLCLPGPTRLPFHAVLKHPVDPSRFDFDGKTTDDEMDDEAHWWLDLD